MPQPPLPTARPLADPARPTPSAARGDAAVSTFGGAVFERPSVVEGRVTADAVADAAGSVFDVCHVGVLLRALVFVHAVVAAGVLFDAAGPADWLARIANGSGIALPAVLLWLLVACALKRPLGALPAPAQWAAVLLLGAVSGAAGAALAALAGGAPADDPPAWARGAASALAGAGLAALVFHWLQLRTLAMLPADTSARLAELQARIRPHFLFNTLNTALALVRLDPARAEGVLEDLAELFRVAISASDASASLADEIELARRYLAIEQIRFGDRLAVNWELDPAAGAARLPPLLLQPLVENAVRHGIEPADAGGVIRIRSRVRLGRAVVAIVNSVPAGPSRPGNGMALGNVRERLRLMHDVAASFESRREGDEFKVQLELPL